MDPATAAAVTNSTSSAAALIDGGGGNVSLATALLRYHVLDPIANHSSHAGFSLSSEEEQEQDPLSASSVLATTVSALTALVSQNLSALAASNASVDPTTNLLLNNHHHHPTHHLLPPSHGYFAENLTQTLQSTLLATAAAAISGSSGSSSEESLEDVGSVVSSTIASTAALDATGNTLSTLSKVIIFVVCLTVILGTVIGNILVCVAVCLVKKLRRPCNYLLVSLALSDLCVAVLVMPVALSNELGDVWPFGTLFCDIWVSFDVLSCTASILNLCAISVDRYWAITKPLEYGVKRTPRRMLMCVALVWLGAACISLPPLLILGNEHVNPETGQPWCNVCQNFGYQIYATFCAFYLPLFIMLFVYYQIFRAARRIVLDEKRAQTRLDQAMLINGHATSKDHHLKVPTNGSTALIGGSGQQQHHQHQQQQQQGRLRFQLAKERKASTTLGIIMSSFTLCWLPFFILAIVRPFLDAEHMVPDSLSSIFLWLGYANSLLNPIIYATLNRDFRKPFREILFFRCSNLNVIMREEYYHSQYGEPASQRVVVGGGAAAEAGQHGARESFL